MLRQRLITAAILITITLAVLFLLPPNVFCVLTGLLTLAATWEWSNLMGLSRLAFRVLYLVIMLFVLFNSLFIPLPMIMLAGCVWWLLALVLVATYPRGCAWWSMGAIPRGLMGILTLVPCWAALNYIRNQGDGAGAILFLFVLVFGADSAAYFAGRQWGATRLAPLVSPGKSVQGVVGALIFAIIATVMVLLFSHVAVPGWPWAIALSVTTVLFSIVGDLFESMLKRKAGLKDSGSLLPGHGGLLDRIDSLTAAAPVFAFGALLLGVYL